MSEKRFTACVKSLLGVLDTGTLESKYTNCSWRPDFMLFETLH